MMLNKPTGFDTTGCWVRTVRRPKEEIEILAKREDLSWRDLLGHDNQQMIGYTDYSCCTYIRETFRIDLFKDDDDDFAVFIRPFNRPIDWWYNGRKGIVTDEIKPEPGIPYDNGATEETDQLRNCTMADIENGVIALSDEYAADYYIQENPDEVIQLNWNEAFLRYQRTDITGLYVNPESKKSVYAALVFRAALKLNVHLYFYDETSGTCNRLNLYALCENFEIDTQSLEFKSARDDYRRHYDVCLTEVRAARETEEIQDAVIAPGL